MLDVCLLLEGSYPFVAGGVATWVHQMITAMKDIRFGIVSIMPNADPTRKAKYEVPNHVIYLKQIFLHDYDMKASCVRRSKSGDYEVVKSFYEELSKNATGSFSEFIRHFRGDKKCLDFETFFSSPEIWKILVSFYDRYASHISFLDFFWTWRATHMPLLQLIQTELPEARMYHAISTGYAGLLGAIMKETVGNKFFLTDTETKTSNPFC